MKPITTIINLILILLGSLSLSANATQNLGDSTKVYKILPAQTPVVLEFRDIDTEELTAGTVMTLRVAASIHLQGTEIIRSGSKATVVIEEINEDLKFYEIIIKPYFVNSVYNDMIHLTSTKSPLSIKIKKQDESEAIPSVEKVKVLVLTEKEEKIYTTPSQNTEALGENFKAEPEKKQITKTQLPDGTIVKLQLKPSLLNNLKKGERINIEVSQQVSIDNQLLINAQNKAIVEIIEVNTKSCTDCTLITIRPIEVIANDNSSIMLRPTEHTIEIPNNKEDAELQLSFNKIISHTLGNYVLTLNK